MSRIAISSGGVGDLIFAIPTIQRLRISKLLICENFYQEGFGSMYTTLKPLMELQGIPCEPTKGGYPLNQYKPKS